MWETHNYVDFNHCEKVTLEFTHKIIFSFKNYKANHKIYLMAFNSLNLNKKIIKKKNPNKLEQFSNVL